MWIAHTTMAIYEFISEKESRVTDEKAPEKIASPHSETNRY